MSENINEKIDKMIADEKKALEYRDETPDERINRIIADPNVNNRPSLIIKELFKVGKILIDFHP